MTNYINIHRSIDKLIYIQKNGKQFDPLFQAKMVSMFQLIIDFSVELVCMLVMSK
jgi:hypothetical protein